MDEKHGAPFLIVLTLLLVNRTHHVSDSTAQDTIAQTDVNETSQASVTQPQIIWFHSVSSNDPASLKLALSSGMVSHVLMLYMHRNDADFRDEKVQYATRLVKAYGAKLIWCRDLWPYYKNGACYVDQIL